MQKVAIIGAGGMGNRHASVYPGIRSAKVAAIVDAIPEAAEKLAKTANAPAYTDFDAMLAEVKPDVIDICLPTPLHKEFVLRAAEAGKHTIVEKPMAASLADCREMIEATKKAGVTFMVAHVLRYFAEFAAGKARVEAGAVGNPAAVRTTRVGGHPGRWFADPSQSGGVILDLIIHDFDWLRWTFGEAERVYAKGLVDSGIENTDYALVTIRFKSGVIAHVEGSWSHPGPFTVKYEIAGDGGLLDHNNQTSATLKIFKKHEPGEKPIPVATESPVNENPYQNMLAHFIDCVETGKKPDITGEDGMRAVEISLAALESIRTGRPVKVGG